MSARKKTSSYKVLKADGHDVEIKIVGGVYRLKVRGEIILCTQMDAEALLALLESAINGTSD